MKKIISIILLVFVLAISLTSCDVLLDTVTGLIDPNKQAYNNALKLIEEKKYEEAYDALKKLEGYAPAEKELENFYLIPVKYVEKSKTSSRQITYEAEYNDKNLVTKITYTSPEASNIDSYFYDSKGNVTRQMNEFITGSYYLLTVTENTFDSNNKLVKSVRTPAYGGYDTEEYEYDSKGNVTKITYTTNTSTTSATSYAEYTYDAKGNLTKEVITGSTGYKTITENTYDTKGRLTKEVITYQQRDQVTTTEYSYNADGKLAEETFSVVNKGPHSYGVVNYKITYSYDKKGNLTERAHIYDVNTIYTFYTYNDANQPTKVEVLYIDLTTKTYEFEYDKYGAVSKMNTTLGFDVEIEWKLAYYKNGVPKNIAELIDTVSYYFYDLKIPQFND